MSEPREAPQPRKSGAGKVLKIVGVIVLLLVCCFCSTCGALLYRGHLEKQEMIETRAQELIRQGIPAAAAREQAEEEIEASLRSSGGDWD